MRESDRDCPRFHEFYGKPATIDDLVNKALKDKSFYDRTGGGVTLSGGAGLAPWRSYFGV